jgi:hypothetical protein
MWIFSDLSELISLSSTCDVASSPSSILLPQQDSTIGSAAGFSSFYSCYSSDAGSLLALLLGSSYLEDFDLTDSLSLSESALGSSMIYNRKRSLFL